MRRFLFVFIALQLLLFGVELLQPVQQHLVLPLTSAIAWTCVQLVSWIDPSVTAYGKVLMNAQSGFGVSIEPGCNGVEACIVLVAAMLAFPARWPHRLLGIAVGIAAIQAFNLVRIVSLFYLGQWNMEWFRFAHEYLWQALIMLDALFVFMLWARRYPQRALAAAHAD
ncbi:exosortase H [Pseudorhodoferax sp.]|uniref:exosortase H n=1 Tax=Pseudorhodoferax sp. TaxID=1993553 RepID=UPI002DD6762A|nr:exosortase H [Pseudorhodoferax sp.]